MKSKKPAVKKKSPKAPVAYQTVPMNGAKGTPVTSAEMAKSGEPKSVTCHGFTRG